MSVSSRPSRAPAATFAAGAAARASPRATMLVTSVLLSVAGSASGCSGGVDPDPGEPVFESTPRTVADHNRPWTYAVKVRDPDGDSLTVEVVRAPSWVDFDPATRTFTGVAGWSGIGAHPFTITASDGSSTTEQRFTLTVERGEIICESDFGDAQASPFVLPYRPGTTQRLIQGYCPPNPAWGHHDWFAYDFDTQNGDTIVASRGGRVLFVREDRPNVGGVCGQQMENFVFIEHEDGTVMQYVHLFTNGALVSVGEIVDQGQAIGLSGNSGCSSGPHVHVALFRDRTNFDRQSTLPFNYARAEGPLDARGGLVQSASYRALPGG